MSSCPDTDIDPFVLELDSLLSRYLSLIHESKSREMFSKCVSLLAFIYPPFNSHFLF